MYARCDFCGTVEKSDTTSVYPVGWITRFVYSADGSNRVMRFCSARCAFLEQDREIRRATQQERTCQRPSPNP